MSGYIDNYRLDLSPAVEALKTRMQDKQVQRQNSINAVTGLAKLMGTVTDSAIRNSDQEQAEIKQLMSSDDGIGMEELLELYPRQTDFINTLFKDENMEEEANEHRRWAEEEMSGYVPIRPSATEDYAQRPAFSSRYDMLENSIVRPYLERTIGGH